MRPSHLVVLAAVGLVMTACSDTEQGSPTARPGSTSNSTTTASSGSSSVAPTSSSSAGQGELAAIDPCSLLSGTDTQAWGLPAQGRRQDVVSTLGCIWPVAGSSLTVTLDPTRGLADINTQGAAKVEDLTVGAHPGRRVEEISGPGYCAFDLAVGDGSSVSVLAIILNRTAEACALAQRAVTVVEPKLP